MSHRVFSSSQNRIIAKDITDAREKNCKRDLEQWGKNRRSERRGNPGNNWT